MFGIFQALTKGNKIPGKEKSQKPKRILPPSLSLIILATVERRL
jgi:hypothetical protein